MFGIRILCARVSGVPRRRGQLSGSRICVFGNIPRTIRARFVLVLPPLSWWVMRAECVRSCQGGWHVVPHYHVLDKASKDRKQSISHTQVWAQLSSTGLSSTGLRVL